MSVGGSGATLPGRAVFIFKLPRKVRQLGDVRCNPASVVAGKYKRERDKTARNELRL